MFKRFLGVITTITVITVIVFAVMNRSSYKSMLFSDEELGSIFKREQVIAPQPTPIPTPKRDTVVVNVDSMVVISTPQE